MILKKLFLATSSARPIFLEKRCEFAGEGRIFEPGGDDFAGVDGAANSFEKELDTVGGIQVLGTAGVASPQRKKRRQILLDFQVGAETRVWTAHDPGCLT